MSGEMLQTLLAGLVVLGALFYVGRRAWRTVLAGRAAKDGDGCGSDCGCGH
jgi:hypothetical protein